jgi:hypothetical protein
VTPKFLTAGEAFQPAEKACWEILLREKAGGDELPAAAAHRAIERSLRQLWSLLRAPSVEEWLRHPPPAPALTWLPKPCGLEGLLNYFGAGQRALQLIVAEIDKTHPEFSAEQRERHAMQLRLAFNILVQRELDGLCGDCARQGRCTMSGRPAPVKTAAVAQPKLKRSRRPR